MVRRRGKGIFRFSPEGFEMLLLLLLLLLMFLLLLWLLVNEHNEKCSFCWATRKQIYSFTVGPSFFFSNIASLFRLFSVVVEK